MRYLILLASIYRLSSCELHNLFGVTHVPLYYDDASEGRHYGKISVGTPPQMFNLLIDSGAGNLIIPSLNCVARFCSVHRKYLSSNSKTYIKNGSVVETKGMTGYLSYDSVHIGGVTIKNQPFVEMVNWRAEFFVKASFDGLIGLGFRKLSASHVITILESAVEQRLLNQPVYGYYIDKEVTDANHIAGHLTFGGVHHDKIDGEITWVETCPSETFWNFTMDSLFVTLKGDAHFGANGNDAHFDANGNDANRDAQLSDLCKGCEVIVDNGLPNIYLDNSSAQVLNEFLGASERERSGRFELDCAKMNPEKQVTFIIGGRPFIFNPEDYIIRKNGTCRTIFQSFYKAYPEGFKPYWVLGDVFTTRVYTAYNFGKKTLGFAARRR